MRRSKEESSRAILSRIVKSKNYSFAKEESQRFDLFVKKIVVFPPGKVKLWDLFISGKENSCVFFSWRIQINSFFFTILYANSRLTAKEHPGLQINLQINAHQFAKRKSIKLQ